MNKAARAFALVCGMVALGGCAIQPIEGEQAARAAAVREYHYGELVKRNYTLAGRIWGQNELSHYFLPGRTSKEAATLALKAEAVKLGADGILNLFCMDQASFWSSDPSFICYANAIKFN